MTDMKEHMFWSLPDRVSSTLWVWLLPVAANTGPLRAGGVEGHSLPLHPLFAVYEG